MRVGAAIALAATDERVAGQIFNVCEEPSSSELAWGQKIAEEMEWQGEFCRSLYYASPDFLVEICSVDEVGAFLFAESRICGR